MNIQEIKDRGPWTDYPDFTQAEWREEVGSSASILGYAEWREHRLEETETETELVLPKEICITEGTN